MEIQVLYEVTKILIEDIRYFIVIINNAIIFYESYAFKVISFVREGWFYSFTEVFVIYNAFGIQIWKVSSFCFFKEINAHNARLLYDFLSSCLIP